MRQYFVLVFVLSSIATSQLHAQRELRNPLIDSKAVLEKGAALQEAGKYKDAIAVYLTVPRSDTSYVDILQEIIVSYHSDSNFVAAEKYGKLALEQYPNQYARWYGLLSSVYDDTERPELAYKAYDTILAQNPYSYFTFYKRGFTQFKQHKYDEATASFQRCVMLNPFYAEAHFHLGALQLLKGNMVQAMMSFTTNLLVRPGNGHRSNALGHMVTISEVNNTATELLASYKPGKEDNFEELQEILLSKVALDKKYKMKASLEDPIVRQLQVFMEKLEYNPNDKGFWMQYYVPLLKSIWDKGQFEPFVFHIFSEFEIKAVKEYVKKQPKKITEVDELASNYFQEIRETQELIESKRKGTKIRHTVRNYKISGKGAFERNAKNELVYSGPWEFFYEDGRLKSKGEFDAKELRQGEWRYYHEDGQVKEISMFRNDLADGVSKMWFDNGVPSSVSNYKNNNLENADSVFYFNGHLRSVINYKAGKMDGKASFYNSDGYLTSVKNYKDDQQEGDETYYHSNGKIVYKLNYAAGKGNGEYKEFDENGVLVAKGAFLADQKNGSWTTYHTNGKIKETKTFLAGELDGEYLSYYDNGKMETRSFHRKGSAEGKKENFDNDGIVFNETMFENGRLRDTKFFDKKGGVISETTSRRGSANVTFYNPAGSKTSQGTYSKEGLAEGKFTYYFENGAVSAETFYKNGYSDGKKVLYYANGKISEESSYKQNNEEGYFVSYHMNGQVSWEGWFVDGQRQGTFIYYDLLGKVTSKVNYLNDKVHGVSEYYTSTGKLDYQQFYEYDWLMRVEQYDSVGKMISISVLDKGAGKGLFKLFNGKPYIQSNYKHYKLDGAYAISNGDGSKRMAAFYRNDRMDSNCIIWHPNGKISAEGKYVNGLKAGQWKYYFYTGEPSETEIYKDGKLQGIDTQFNEDGTLDKTIMFKDGVVDGETKIYGDNGNLAVVYYHEAGDLKGYSYEDKAGKLLPMIPLVNQAGVLESYYSNGVKSAHMTFLEGEINGERTLYFSNGKVYVSGSRVMGAEHGSKKVYFPNGKIKQDENYYFGKQHGSFKLYDENGKLLSDRTFHLDLLHGESKYYTNDKLTHTYVYHSGELQSKK